MTRFVSSRTCVCLVTERKSQASNLAQFDRHQAACSQVYSAVKWLKQVTLQNTCCLMDQELTVTELDMNSDNGRLDGFEPLYQSFEDASISLQTIHELIRHITIYKVNSRQQLYTVLPRIITYFSPHLGKSVFNPVQMYTWLCDIFPFFCFPFYCGV